MTTTQGSGHLEFLRALEQQRAAYAASLAGRISGMELLWKAVCARTADADDLARLERCAHSLAGSGAVFGHDSLSARARGLERELHRIVERGSPGEGEAANVGAAIAALRRCL